MDPAHLMWGSVAAARRVLQIAQRSIEARGLGKAIDEDVRMVKALDDDKGERP
jgi:hypothetical protein